MDGSSGQLVPTISQIGIEAGSRFLSGDAWLDNFTFATPVLPGSVSPVPEGNVWALVAVAALAAAVGRAWRLRRPHEFLTRFVGAALACVRVI